MWDHRFCCSLSLGGRDQSLIHDVTSAIKYGKCLLIAPLMKAISSNGGPPSRDGDGRFFAGSCSEYLQKLGRRLCPLQGDHLDVGEVKTRVGAVSTIMSLRGGFGPQARRPTRQSRSNQGWDRDCFASLAMTIDLLFSGLCTANSVSQFSLVPTQLFCYHSR